MPTQQVVISHVAAETTPAATPGDAALAVAQASLEAVRSACAASECARDQAIAAWRASEATRAAAIEELALLQEQLRCANEERSETLTSAALEALAERDLLLGQLELLEAEVRLRQASGVRGAPARAGGAARYDGRRAARRRYPR